MEKLISSEAPESIEAIPDNFQINTKQTPQKQEKKVEQKKKIASGWDNDEEEEEEVEDEHVETTAPQLENLKLTVKITDLYKDLFRNSNIIGIQAVLGNYSSVQSMMNNQLGILNLSQFKTILRDIYLSSHAQIRLNPCSNTSEITIKEINSGKGLPINGITKERINSLMNIAFDYIDNKEMEFAEKAFKNVLKMAIFYIAYNDEDVEFIKNIINSCGEYLIMIKLNEKAEAAKADKFIYSSICLLITVCKLSKPIHQFLMLKRAKIACKNIKNYVSALGLIQKMLNLEPLLKEYDGLGIDKLLQEYNTIKEKGNEKDYEFNIKDIDNRNIKDALNASTLELINQSKSYLKCPLCDSKYDESLAKTNCLICGLSILGKEVVGISFLDKNFKK